MLSCNVIVSFPRVKSDKDGEDKLSFILTPPMP